MSSQDQSAASAGVEDRLSYLWLVLALLLFPFGSARWNIPLAAWVYPIFLLRFVRTQPLRRGLPLVLLAIVLVLEVAWRGFLGPMPEAIAVPLLAAIGALYTLPYLIDRLVAPRLGGLAATLVFPCAVTTMYYVNAVVSPNGTWGNLAYTQYGNLPLLQLLSVTGLWGIVFLMSWLASMVNWAWEQGLDWPEVRGGVALYGSVLAVVLLLGGARLAVIPPSQGTVRVAGVSPSHSVIAAYNSRLSQGMTNALVSGASTPADREAVHRATAPVFDELLARSAQEASAGAKIVVWPEGSGNVFLLQEDQATLLARARALARASGTYLDLGMAVMPKDPAQFRDEIILIDSAGSIVWRYQKAHPMMGVERERPGDGKVPTVQTPFGRLSNVICTDADHPDTLRQAGSAGADIMLVPSTDWREVDPYHTQAITFRAIENGYSLVRQTSSGLAVTVDYEGRVLGASDDYATDPQVMVAEVPVRGVRTVYATIGDLFAWLSGAGLTALIGVALVQSRKAE